MKNNKIYKKFLHENSVEQKTFLKLIFILVLIKIVKNNRITNIIWIGDINFRYINFANFSNGDMIIETTSCPGSSKRMFYGLKQNGEYFFNKNGISTPFYSIISENDTNGQIEKYESEIFVAKMEDNNKEYIVSISIKEQYCELYDFEENKIIKIKSSDFLGSPMTSIRETTNTIISEGKNYIIFSFLSNDILNVKKLLFNSKDLQNNVTIVKTYNLHITSDEIGNSISCFKCQIKDIIICFYLYGEKNGNDDYESLYNIIVLNSDLEYLTSESFRTDKFYPNSFYKCINLNYNIGVFIYYEFNNQKRILFPYLKIKRYLENKIQDYYSDHPVAKNIEINYHDEQFNENSLLNDIIKISNTKVCFSTTSNNKEILYIIIATISQNFSNIKYYLIELFRLHNYKFLLF